MKSKIDTIINNTEEISNIEKLKKMDLNMSTAYIGFEPSGFVHIGQGMIYSQKIKDFQQVGINVKILIADYFSYINNKLNSNWNNIDIAGEYLIDVFTAFGVDTDKIDFIWSSDIMNGNYFDNMLKISNIVSISRTKRALTAMGKIKTDDSIAMSSLLYPIMQITDIFQFNVDIVYGGIDQRKVHMLALDISKKLNKKKPIIIHTPILTNLNGKNNKMSKSDPNSSILIHDSPKIIKNKINKAYCPIGIIENNPLIEIIKYIIFPQQKFLYIERPEKYGGNIVFKKYIEFEKMYIKKQIHPIDLKNAVIYSLIKLLEPIQEYFKKHPENYLKLQEVIDEMEEKK